MTGGYLTDYLFLGPDLVPALKVLRQLLCAQTVDGCDAECHQSDIETEGLRCGVRNPSLFLGALL